MKKIMAAVVVLSAVLPLWCQAPAPGTAPKAKQGSPFADYAGTWTASFNGSVWLQLQLELKAEQLTGSLVHARNINWNDNGELKSVSEEQSTESVAEAVVNPDGLLLTLKDGDTQETDRYMMKLVLPAKDAADLKVIGMQLPPGMAKPKPWRVMKSGVATTNQMTTPR